MKISIICIAAFFLTIPLSAQETKEPGKWISLFNGKDLDGWVQRGGKAKYTIEGDAIVGTTVSNTPNSFLCSEKDYGDFILELEFKIDPALNCGVQIRSESKPDYRKGVVHGYQVEIDPSDRAWSAGIYDESRRGWLDDHQDNRAARYAFKQNEWNHYRIEVIGARIRTFINGVPAADLVDAMTLKGFIALQVHGIGKRDEKLQVRYRKIRIQDLGESSWEPIFNGKDLSGWKPTVEGTWSVKDGILHGKSPASEKRHSILLRDGNFSDFTMRVRYRAIKGNSGIYFRVKEVDSSMSVNGFQAEIDSDGNGAGGIYETGGRKWVSKPTPEAIEKYFKKGDWNVMDISAYGTRTTIHVNNTKSVELFNDPGNTSGKFGPQLHGGMDMDIAFSQIDLLKTQTKFQFPEHHLTFTNPRIPLVEKDAEFRKLGEGYKFTEGPALAPDGRILFNDIPNERTHIYDPKTGEISIYREPSGRANGLYFTATGALIACEGGNRRLTRSWGDEVTVLADDFEGKKLNSPNDCVIDGAGGIYFTDPRYGNNDGREIDIEAVYYFDRRGKLTQVVNDMGKPNGIILSPDNKTLYIADTKDKKIIAYDVIGEGKITNKREFANIGSDGLTVDVRGNIYCTWQGEIVAFAPDGKEVLRLKCPEGPANCLLVGKTLYVTARTGFYAIDLGVNGL